MITSEACASLVQVLTDLSSQLFSLLLLACLPFFLASMFMATTVLVLSSTCADSHQSWMGVASPEGGRGTSLPLTGLACLLASNAPWSVDFLHGSVALYSMVSVVNCSHLAV